MRCIALVVPALSDDGGVPAVARFIKNIVLNSGEFDLKVVSLAMSARDECSVRLTRPRTWWRGVTVRTGDWQGLRYDHVGALWSELEFQRYRARSVLIEMLSDCDLIQVVSGAASWALPVMELGKPVVLQVATRTIVERRRKELVDSGPLARWRWIMTRITDRLDDRALRSVDAVLVENSWMLAYASTTTADHETWVRYAPPGVDVELFHPLPSRAPESRGSHYILSVGRFGDPRKNIGMLLDAYVMMRRGLENPPQLKLAGAEDPGLEFWGRVETLGLGRCVSFDHRPTQKALVEYYQNALCFALPSDEEGFGIVLTEAMACALPVVATRCGGPEGIVNEGVDGFLVPRGDPVAMAERLRRLAQDPALNKAMGLSARRMVEVRFANDVAGAIYLDTYRKLLFESAS